MYTQISNSDDFIDSRDIIDRIGELELSHQIAMEADEEWDDDEKEELEKLNDFLDEVRNVAEDWEYGATIIHEDYFVTYAEELARDIGAVGGEVEHWPLMYIDWEAAAEALKYDYSVVDFDGSTYYTR